MEQTKEKKLPKLTKRRKGFVKDYVETGNGAEAARRNFNVSNDNSARAVASELLTFPNVAQAIEIEEKSLRQALEEQGVTKQKIALKVNELLDNKDPNAIDKGLKHALAINGVTPDEEKPKGNTTYNILFSAETQADIREIENRIKTKLLNPAQQ